MSNSASTVVAACDECSALREAFIQAVHRVMLLHEQYAQGIIRGEDNPQRFDLLIHEATEDKQDAKYAYLHHRETHETCGE